MYSLKVTRIYHLVPLRMAIIKKSTNNNAVEEVEKKSLLFRLKNDCHQEFLSWHSGNKSD